MTMQDFSWSSVGISMAAGATGYGLSTVIERNVAKMAAGKVVTSVVKTTSEVAADMTVSLAEDYVKTGEVDLGNSFENAVLGQGVGKMAEGVVEPIVKNSPEVKSLEKKAEQLERRAKNNPKESPNTNRNREAKDAREKYDKTVANKVGRAATVSSGAATKTKDLIKNKNQQNSGGGGKLVAPKPCFVAGTLVATNKGYLPIEDVKDGDSVLTYSIADKKLQYQIVKDKHQSITDSIVVIILSNGEKVETTPIHSFYVNAGKWVPAGQLTEKDFIWFANGSKGKIKEIYTVTRQEVVYNFEVPITHNYFVSKGKILVHNSENQRCR